VGQTPQVLRDNPGAFKPADWPNPGGSGTLDAACSQLCRARVVSKVKVFFWKARDFFDRHHFRA